MPRDPTLASDTANQSETSASHLYALALKLPVFWPDSCESWFINAESQFHLKNITCSRTKFHHVVASLPQKEIDNVVDMDPLQSILFVPDQVSSPADKFLDRLYLL